MDLFDAVTQGNEQLVQKCIKQSSAGINEVDEQGFMALHYAVKSKNLQMLETLCKYGAGINERTAEGLLKTPLYMAADAGDLEMVKCLVQSQASVDLPSDSDSWYKENGQTPLHRAAYKGYLNIVEFLVNECGADVNIVDTDGSTPLHLAASLGRKDVATFLTSKGADVDKEDSSGSTPLNCASDRGYLATVSFLLQKGAQLGQKDANGLTALHRAARKGNTNVLNHLLDSGADIEQQDKKGLTSLHIAARRGQKSCASLLLKRGANINLTDKSGQTPLHHAADKGHLEMIEALLDNGAEINHKDEAEETSLHVTSKKGHPDILRYLLAHGAKPDIQNNDGKTAHDCASDDHIQRILSRFQKDGVILDSEDEFLFDSGFEDDESGGEPTQDELYNIANTVGSVLDLWELCKELRMEDDTIAKALPIVVHYTSIALQILKSWSQEKPGNEKAKKKILKTIPEYKLLRSGKTKKYDVLLEQLSTEIYTMTILLKMTSKLKYQARDVICQIDQSSSPPTKQRLWDATVELLSKWVVGGGKRDELLRALQVRHLTEPAEVVSTAIQQEPGLADSFSFTTIGRDGGDIQLGEGDVQVSLPPGALGKETCEVVTVKVPNHAPKLICEEDEVQASPPVLCTPSGLKFDEPVKLTVPHCTSLDKITDETEVILYTSHGTADYTREVLSREDYTITDDSVVVNVRHFSLFTIVMRKLRGVKFGLLPLHPSIMPRSRKPLLQVFFYQMYKRNETIGHTKLRERKSNKTSFELEFGKKEYGSKNIRITLLQGSNELESSLFEVRMQEPEPTIPHQVATDFPTHLSDVVQEKLYGGNPVSTQGTSPNPVWKIGTKCRTFVDRMIMALTIVLAGSSILVAGSDSTERVTLQAGKPGVVPFHFQWSPNDTSQVVPYYTLRFESNPRPFCINGEVDIKGFKNPSQIRRFSTSVTDLQSSPCVKLNIDNVDTVDEERYLLTVVLHSFDNVRYETIKKEVDVQIPPGRAKCFITLSGYVEYPYEIHCRATTGSVITTLSCYHNNQKIDVKGDITDNGQVTNGIFLLPDYTHFSCCSHYVTSDVSETMCNDFEWPHDKETTRQIVNTVPTSVTNPTPQVESNPGSGACRQFMISSLWHFTFVLVYLLAFVTIY